MTDDLDSTLKKLLDQYDKKRLAADERKRQIKTEEDTFLDNFTELRRQVIKPTLEKLGNLLKQRGHDFHIYEEEYTVDHDSKTRDAKISIRIIPAGTKMPGYAHHDYPSLSFIATRYKKTIFAHSSNMMPNSGGSAGPRGEYQLAQINKELIESEFLRLIAEIVNK